MSHFTPRRRGFLRSAVAILMIAAVIPSGGCYGSFPLTNLLYGANGKITNSRIIHSIVMIVLVIIPAYQICMIVDGIIFNSVEFWTGDDLEFSKSETLSDGTIATLSPGATKDEATLTLTRDGVVVTKRYYKRVNPTRTLVIDDTGAIISVVDRTEDGGLIIRGERGRTEVRHSGAEIAQLLESKHL